MTDPLYPDVTVPLTGEDGNVFSIIGRATAAAKRAEVPRADVDSFVEEVFGAGSYNEALRIVMRWFGTE